MYETVPNCSKWRKSWQTGGAFYEACGHFPRTGERAMTVGASSRCTAEHPLHTRFANIFGRKSVPLFLKQYSAKVSVTLLYVLIGYNYKR
jgi:hypothetical protein